LKKRKKILRIIKKNLPTIGGIMNIIEKFGIDRFSAQKQTIF